MTIVGRQTTTGEGIIGRIRGRIHGGRAAADIGRGAVPRVQGADAPGLGRLNYRHGQWLRETIVSVRHTGRRAVTNRTFKVPEFIGGLVTDG